MKRVDAIIKAYGSDKTEPIILSTGEEIHPWNVMGADTIEEAKSLLEIGSDSELEMLYDNEKSAVN